MPETQRFDAAATVTVDAKPGDIWAVWVDVNAWKNWDDGVESTRLHGNFKVGNRFTLTPRGGEPLEVTLTSVTQGEEFVDEAVLPFGTIVTSHRMEPLGERILLTHSVTARIDDTMAPVFGKDIWPHLQRGLSEALNGLADLVSGD
ncbi:SRPBCC family protein [Streptomyces sp. BH097]|uniref:SRPBCC family protein n=1 Tax=unclassified Streptomyces TaxID=2593676 RepID=UPI003BB6B64E